MPGHFCTLAPSTAAPETGKIYVSLTSIASREAQLRITLKSLCEQNLQDPYEVHVFLSREPFLLDRGWTSLPNWPELEASPFRDLLRFHFVPNVGSYRKLHPILDQMLRAGQNPVIVTADDDVIYPSNWLRTLVAEHAACGGIVAYRGHTMACDNAGIRRYKEWISEPKLGFSLLNIATGREGVLYRPSHLDSAALDISTALRLAPTADDLWYKMHSLLARTPVRLLLEGLSNFPDTTTPDNPDTLWRRFNAQDGNDASLRALINHLQQAHSFSAPHFLSRISASQRPRQTLQHH